MHYHEINYVWILNDNQLHKREIPYQDVTKKPASDFFNKQEISDDCSLSSKLGD